MKRQQISKPAARALLFSAIGGFLAGMVTLTIALAATTLSSSIRLFLTTAAILVFIASAGCYAVLYAAAQKRAEKAADALVRRHNIKHGQGARDDL